MNFNDPNTLNLNDININTNDNNNINMENQNNTSFHPNMFQDNNYIQTNNFEQNNFEQNNIAINSNQNDNQVYNLADFSQNNNNPIDNITNPQYGNGGNIDTNNDEDGPNTVELDEFKNVVKSYLQIDNDIKKLRQVVKEKNNQKNVLMPRIIDFMTQYNIEDLNTQEGVLRYKKTFVKSSLSQTNIKTKIIDFFDNSKKSEELTKYIFDNREKVEKISLRRLKK